MLIATAVLLCGLVAGIIAAQLYGLRLGGVLIVPLVAVYLLRSFGTFPVFVLSTVAAYASISYIKTRLPLYGRQLFVLSIFIGALVPVTIVELLVAGVGAETAITDVEFLGSVLPGIAAYNFHRLDTEQRVLDGVVSLAVLLFLVVVGIGLTFLVGLSPLAGTLPPLLLAPESDIALAFGLTVDRPPLPVITSNSLSLVLVIAGMAIAELVRFRYQLRVAGIIVVPLVVLITFRNGMLLPVWMLATVGAYGSIQLVHWWTLLYGRVLLAFGIIVSILTTVSLVSVVPVIHGVLPFFVGLLGGVTAYNIHVVPPRERPATIAVIAGTLVTVGFIARLLVTPPPTGLLTEVTVQQLQLGAVIVLLALAVLANLERIEPPQSVSNPTEPMDPLSGWRGGD